MQQDVPTTAVMLAMIAMLSTSTAVRAADILLDGVAAKVGTIVIMRSDVRLARDLGLVPATLSSEQAVGRLVERTLMVAEVNRFQPPDPLIAAVNDRLAELRAQAGPSAWDAALRRAGVDEQYVRALVRERLRVDAYVRQRFASLATPSEEDLRQVYDERRSPLLQVPIIPPFDTVKDRLRDELTRTKLDALVAEWVGELRGRAEVRLAESKSGGGR